MDQEILQVRAGETSFYDTKLVVRATITDLDRYTFERYVQQAYQQSLADFPMSYEILLQNLGLAHSVGDQLHPTVAALLFFGTQPQRFVPQAHVMAARIPGTDLAVSPTDVKRIEGTLPAMLDDALRFLRIHLPVAHQIEGFGSEQRPEVPDVALREVMVNALAHRSAC